MEGWSPLKDWRKNCGIARWDAAHQLGMSLHDYVLLEESPDKCSLNSDWILFISRETNIPLEALVDYLAATPKEVD